MISVIVKSNLHGSGKIDYFSLSLSDKKKLCVMSERVTNQAQSIPIDVLFQITTLCMILQRLTWLHLCRDLLKPLPSTFLLATLFSYNISVF